MNWHTFIKKGKKLLSLNWTPARKVVFSGFCHKQNTDVIVSMNKGEPTMKFTRFKNSSVYFATKRYQQNSS
jgi:hypothetical protein